MMKHLKKFADYLLCTTSGIICSLIFLIIFIVYPLCFYIGLQSTPYRINLKANLLTLTAGIHNNRDKPDRTQYTFDGYHYYCKYDVKTQTITIEDKCKGYIDKSFIEKLLYSYTQFPKLNILLDCGNNANTAYGGTKKKTFAAITFFSFFGYAQGKECATRLHLRKHDFTYWLLSKQRFWDYHLHEATNHIRIFPPEMAPKFPFKSK